MIKFCSVFCIILLFHSISSASIKGKRKSKRDLCVDKVNAISSNIAVKAAQDAKAAEDAQAQAGAAASKQIKQEFAEYAIEAAKAAQASLAGKIEVVEELTKEKEALNMVVPELLRSKSELEKAINAELKALSEGKGLQKILNTALHVAQNAATDADSSLKGINTDLVGKDNLLQSALHKTEELAKEEQAAKTDLENVKQAAKKAVQSATDAKANVLRNRRAQSRSTKNST